MNTTQLQKKEGFTIIEVVLVLAIAALIMLLVFLAWPALQRGQRDQGRKNDVSLMGSAIGTHKTNNKGRLPSLAALKGYMDEQGMSQYTPNTDIVAAGTPDAPASNQPALTNIGQVRYVPGHKCADSGGGTIRQSGRQAAIQYVVEANGSNMPQCQDV